MADAAVTAGDRVTTAEREIRRDGAFARNVRATMMIWRRDIIRLFRMPARLISGVAQPVLFLFVLGAGLENAIGDQGAAGVDYQQYLFPGILAMSVLTSALFSAIAIVWDAVTDPIMGVISDRTRHRFGGRRGWLPLGGFVKITGMNPDEVYPPEGQEHHVREVGFLERVESVDQDHDPDVSVPGEPLPPHLRERAYYAQPVWKRIVVIAAGPAMNILIAFLVFFALALTAEEDTNLGVGEIESGSPAAAVLQEGDRLVAVNGVKPTDDDLGDRADKLAGQFSTSECAGELTDGCTATKPAEITIVRAGQRIRVVGVVGLERFEDGRLPTDPLHRIRRAERLLQEFVDRRRLRRAHAGHQCQGGDEGGLEPVPHRGMPALRRRSRAGCRRARRLSPRAGNRGPRGPRADPSLRGAARGDAPAPQLHA